jgi:hypothetical protein
MEARGFPKRLDNTYTSDSDIPEDVILIFTREAFALIY